MKLLKINSPFNKIARNAPTQKYKNIPNVNWGFPSLMILNIVSLS